MEDRYEVLEFRANLRKDGARLVSILDGELVLLDRYAAKAAEVNEGETWRCTVTRKALVWVAVPIDRIRPPIAPRGLSASVLASTGSADPSDESGSDEARAAAVLDALPLSEPGPRLLSGNPMPPEEVINPGERVAVFVDGPMIEAASRRHGWVFDWYAILDLFANAAKFGGAYYYTLPTATERTLSRLARAGFNVRTAPTDPAIATQTMLIQFATEAAMRGSKYETVFLFTTEPAYLPLVVALQGRGKRVHIVADLDALPPSLAHIADKLLFSLQDFSLLANAPLLNEAEARPEPHAPTDAT